MLNNLMTHWQVRKKNVKFYYKQIAVISVKWFHMMVEVKLGLQYKPENLDVNKV